MLSLTWCVIVAALLLLNLVKWTSTAVGKEILVWDNAQPGTLLGKIFEPQDVTFLPALQDSHSLSFMLTNYLPGHEYFQLDNSTSLLTVKRSVDYDKFCDEIRLCCERNIKCRFPLSVAIRGKPTGEPQIFEFYIVLTDENDHTPEFPTSDYHITIPESTAPGKEYPLPLAKDPDSYLYSVQTYTLELVESQSYSNPFVLDVRKRESVITNVYLKVIRLLDREKVPKYELRLRAKDGGRPFRQGVLSIHVVCGDENDNFPIFEKETYNVEIREGLHSTDGLPFIQLNAKDADIGENALVQYEFSDETRTEFILQHFELNPESGALYLRKPLDYEKQTFITFTVVARNPGHSQTSTAKVHITVLNINDERPVIHVQYWTNTNYTTIMENSEPMTFIAMISVSDADPNLGGMVTCQVMTPQEYVILKESPRTASHHSTTNFNLLLKQPFDHEQGGWQIAVITCQDQGSPALSSTAKVNIKVEDVNDNSPKIVYKQEYRLKEHSPPETEVAHLYATDADSEENGRVSFSMEQALPVAKEYLQIDEISGRLTTKREIDRETDNDILEKIPVTVVAMDHGTPTRSSVASFEVIILDINDNKPYFLEPPLTFSLSENLPARTRVGEIRVRDLDTLSQESLHLIIFTKNYQHPPFVIVRDPDSKAFFLNTTRSLDRESESEYHFQLVLTDAVLPDVVNTAICDVTVLVEDVNDHSPAIMFPREANQTFFVSWKEWERYQILTVSVNDRDKNEDNKFSYELLPWPMSSRSLDLFEIGTRTGLLYLRKKLVRDEMGEYFVRILVRDSGNPPKESSVQIRIVIDESPPHSSEDNQYRRDPLASSEKRTSQDSYSWTPLWRNSFFLAISLTFLILLIIFVFILLLYCRLSRVNSNNHNGKYSVARRGSPTVRRFTCLPYCWNEKPNSTGGTAVKDDGRSPTSQRICKVSDLLLNDGTIIGTTSRHPPSFQDMPPFMKPYQKETNFSQNNSSNTFNDSKIQSLHRNFFSTKQLSDEYQLADGRSCHSKAMPVYHELENREMTPPLLHSEHVMKLNSDSAGSAAFVQLNSDSYHQRARTQLPTRYAMTQSPLLSSGNSSEPLASTRKAVIGINPTSPFIDHCSSASSVPLYVKSVWSKTPSSNTNLNVPLQNDVFCRIPSNTSVKGNADRGIMKGHQLGQNSIPATTAAASDNPNNANTSNYYSICQTTMQASFV